MKAYLPIRTATWVALGLTITGCDRLSQWFGDKAPIVYVDLVDPASDAPGAPTKLARARLEETMRQVMDAWPDFDFRKAKEQEPKWQVNVRVELLTERLADPGPDGKIDADRVRRAVGLSMTLHQLVAPEGQAAVVDRFTTEVVETRDEAKATPFENLASEALVRAGERIARMYALTEASADTVVGQFAASEKWLSRTALQVASARKLKEAVPPLMAIVRDEDAQPQLVLQAIGALVSIGDPSAAPALIDAGRRKNSAYVAQIVFALGQLGGREAEGYLFTVQSGHPDPALRDAASEALEELERRRDANAPE